MTREQMFTFGHRPETMFKLSLGASADGKLTAVKHEAVAETSQFEDYCEIVVNWSGEAYQCDNVTLDYKVAPIDVYTPLDMRAPGAVWGMYALECAIDELAAKVGMDPLEFRRKNYAPLDQNTGKEFSSKELRACYDQGAERFGWAKRSKTTGSMRKGRKLIGWGMATGIWDALSGPSGRKGNLQRRRQAGGQQRNSRHWYGHVHDHDADRCRRHGTAGGKRDLQAWRLLPANVTDRRWLLDRRDSWPRGENGLRRHRRGAAQTRRQNG